MADAKNESKKTMDIAKPGRSAPNTSSRPVVVSNKPEISDPMVTPTDQKPVISDETDNTEVAEAMSSIVTKSHGKIIEPVSKSNTAEDSETTEQKEAKKESAVVDAVASQADKGNKNDQSEEQALKRQEAVNGLIQSKKYFVPIGAVARRRNKRALATIIILLVVASASYLAVDAEIIKSSIKLPIEFIK